MSDDPYNLQRFLTAHAGDFDRARDELKAGNKETHWIWFVFPQIKGLGASKTSEFYAISSREEARAFLTHPTLGPHLEEVTQIVIDLADRTLHDIFGTPDDLKFRSSMTLFSEVAGPGSIFQQALDKYCTGKKDPRTLELLKNG